MNVQIPYPYQKLVGQIGTLDIAICVATVEELAKHGISDRERRLVLGGSASLLGPLIYVRSDNACPLVVAIGRSQDVVGVACIAEFATSDVPGLLFTGNGPTVRTH